eukprot:CAMPEP_0173172280 /NCGR_PEP_ID=MMETSP1141-20130122/2223_1 /TAXON_ID=483371 /ORGANISM="non described non described, Strain CCMP2298" /LENGTH=214 /DNA_ID=CAMNT_0014094303 /DNA_START=368 /DNA_END=1009 /DNA_ORIENTATION=-
MKLYLLVLALVALCEEAAGRPTNMLRFCDRTMNVGDTIMGSTVVGSTSRSVRISRSGSFLASNDAYNPGETLTVTLSSTAGDYIFESAGATFSGGSCSATSRVVISSAQMQMPDAGGGPVTVKAAWALQRGTVTITEEFTLTEGALVTVAPSGAVTVAPTPKPTKAPPTRPPTEAPTPKPTKAPPTRPPTEAPTPKPTKAPPTRPPTEAPTPKP